MCVASSLQVAGPLKQISRSCLTQYNILKNAGNQTVAGSHWHPQHFLPYQQLGYQHSSKYIFCVRQKKEPHIAMSLQKCLQTMIACSWGRFHILKLFKLLICPDPIILLDVAFVAGAALRQTVIIPRKWKDYWLKIQIMTVM